MAGVLFALEEAVSFFEPAVIIRTLFTAMLAYLIVGGVSASKETGRSRWSEKSYALFPVSILFLYLFVFLTEKKNIKLFNINY